MPESRPTPWNPDRRWADPLILLLLLLSVFSTLGALAQRRKILPQPQRPGLQARVRELQSAALGLWPRIPKPGPELMLQGSNPWDRALLAILAAEEGQGPLARRLALEGNAAPGFQRCWRAAYGQGELPESCEIDALRTPLGDGYAYARLQARLAERQALDPEPLRAKARAWALPRLLLLGFGGLGALTLGLVGLVSGIILLVRGNGSHPERLPRWAMPWRAAALAFLGWFVALRFSGTVAVLIIGPLHLPRILALPMAVAFHASVGAWLLLKAEGTTLRAAWRRMAPGRTPAALAWAVPFLGIAIATVVLVGMLAGPWFKGSEPPQREIQELVSGLAHPFSTLLLLLTMAGLAPIFEEWLFRGVILPWMGQRLATRLGIRAGWGLALLVSGLTFGAMHLQAPAFPALSALGLVLGWAFLRTDNLWTAIAIHALWNASNFALMRVLA